MRKFWTAEEVADYLRLKVGTIYKWHCVGKLNGVKIGGRLVFDSNYICELFGGV